MPVADDPPLHDFPDRALCQSLQHPQHLRAFLTQAAPELEPGFVCERARLLDREFPLDDWRRRESDLLFEVPYRSADEEHPALLATAQSSQADAVHQREVQTVGQTIAEWYIEQGELNALQKALLRLGRQRFGEPDAQTAGALVGLTDLQRLEQLTDRLLQVSSWPELLQSS